MTVRYRSATPGTLLCLAATILLAIVSFNTPLLKSLYFLSATYSSGDYAGTLNLGTLGYCLTYQGTETCVGPTVGYEFNPNTLLGVTVFDIPETITKYLTYTLVLHIIALAFAAVGTVFGLLSHISTLSLLCFPTCTASLASTFSLLALIFDLVIFYIAKARIDSVSGASASIGICVWLTLAAWLLAGLSGCAYGIGRCCVGGRGRQESGDPKLKQVPPGGSYTNTGADEMRLHAIRDEQLRKKEQGLPSFQELERTPLTNGDTEDKYLYEDERTMPGGLRRDGSVLHGVGVGYGRRNNSSGGGVPYQAYTAGAAAGAAAGAYAAPLSQRRLSGSTVVGPGAAGIGAGGVGMERPEPAAGYGNTYYDQGHQDYYQGGYSAPYNSNQGYPDPYQQGYSDNNYASQQLHGEHDYRTTPSPLAMPMPTAAPSHGYGNAQPGYSGGGGGSSESYDPGPRVTQADPYDGYDDGLGAIGMAAQSGAGRHERDYTGQTFGYDPGRPPTSPGSAQGMSRMETQGNLNAQVYGGGAGQIHAPSPQHLVDPTAANILRSPILGHNDVGQGQRELLVGQGHYGHNAGQGDYGYGQGQGQGYGIGNGGESGGGEDGAGRPPSYGSVAGVQYATRAEPEKSGYHR